MAEEVMEYPTESTEQSSETTTATETEASPTTSLFDVITSKVIYRNYSKPNADPTKAPLLTILKQSKDAANFAEVEKDGYSQITENSYTCLLYTSPAL